MILRRLSTLLVLAGAALAPAAPAAASAPVAEPAPPTQDPPGTVLDGTVMWIHELPRSSGGDPDAIAARARRSGIRAVIVKAAHGARYWPQFSRELVDALHARGLKVCGYQRSLSKDPRGEAVALARAKSYGADCVVLDPEAEYEGRYAQARVLVRELRRRVGADYPVGFTSFPYVDYHASLPYSVFLGPGGAQFNLPQVYWWQIGDSVDRAMARTYRWNRIYDRPIYPLGQLWRNPPMSSVRRFRALAQGYGAKGLSWWVWQLAPPRYFDAVGGNVAAAKVRDPGWPELRRGSRGDPVRQLQLELREAGQPIGDDGRFGPNTVRAVSAFQAARGLPVTGRADGATWQALLAPDEAAG